MKLIRSLLITLALAVAVFAQGGSFECRVTEIHQNLQPMAAVLRGTTAIAVATCNTRNRASECRGKNAPKGCSETVVEIKLDHPNSWPEGKPKVGSVFRARWDGESLQRLPADEVKRAHAQPKSSQRSGGVEIKQLKPGEVAQLKKARQQVKFARKARNPWRTLAAEQHLHEVEAEIRIAYGETPSRSNGGVTLAACFDYVSVELKWDYALIRRGNICDSSDSPRWAPKAEERKHAHAQQDKPKAITDASRPTPVPGEIKMPERENVLLKGLQSQVEKIREEYKLSEYDKEIKALDEVYRSSLKALEQKYKLEEVSKKLAPVNTQYEAIIKFAIIDAGLTDEQKTSMELFRDEKSGDWSWRPKKAETPAKVN